MDSLLADLNLDQRRAVTHTDGPLKIVAGAGTGKTGTLTRRFAWLVQQGMEHAATSMTQETETRSSDS